MDSVWYHGTYCENVASIRQHGLYATHYGDNFKGLGPLTGSCSRTRVTPLCPVVMS